MISVIGSATPGNHTHRDANVGDQPRHDSLIGKNFNSDYHFSWLSSSPFIILNLDHQHGHCKMSYEIPVVKERGVEFHGRIAKGE